MPSESFRILALGDIVGRPGRRVLKKGLPQLKEEYQPHVVVANVENAAGGFGVNTSSLSEVWKAGVDVGTSGNHIWDKKDGRHLLENGENPLLRPHNYPSSNPGRGFVRLEVEGSYLEIWNLQGEVFMPPSGSPFLAADELIQRTPPGTIIVVDFHAEATAEKIALARYLDGKVSALWGTHTHVATSDLEVFPGGTGYLSDLGMCGAKDGVIGMRSQDSLHRFQMRTPHPLTVASGPAVLHGALFEIDRVTTRCVSLSPVTWEDADP